MIQDGFVCVCLYIYREREREREMRDERSKYKKYGGHGWGAAERFEEIDK